MFEKDLDLEVLLNLQPSGKLGYGGPEMISTECPEALRAFEMS